MHRFLKWRESLYLAGSVSAVEAIMREYVDVVAAVAQSLPEDCKRAIAHPLDIQDAAVTLMQAELQCRGESDEHALLHEAAHTFAAAAVRITQLHGAPAVAERLSGHTSDSRPPPEEGQ
jgi:hypothetical protein